MNERVSQHTVSAYDNELTALSDAIESMASDVLELIAIGLESLENPEEIYAEQSKAITKRIYETEKAVDTQATAMLALRQPMAIDLRFITSVLKMTESLAQMGDLARNAVKRIDRAEAPVIQQSIVDFRQVAAVVADMVRDLLVAFKELDPDKAAHVWNQDDRVDELYHGLFTTLQNAMIANPASIPSYMQIAFAAKNFERLGDQVTRLAKIVHYIASGKRKKKLKIKTEEV